MSYNPIKHRQLVRSKIYGVVVVVVPNLTSKSWDIYYRFIYWNNGH